MTNESASNYEYTIFAGEASVHVYRRAQTPATNAKTEPFYTDEIVQRKDNYAVATLKLALFHILNFVYAAFAFIVTVTIVTLSIGLLPLLGLGAFVYVRSMPVVGWLANIDIALANRITPIERRVALNKEIRPSDLEFACDVGCLSWRSTFAVFYFSTIKLVTGVFSFITVCFPVLPIALHIIYSQSVHGDDKLPVGSKTDAFSFSTDPVWFSLAWIGHIIVGLVLIHLVGRMSLALTHLVCCRESTTAMPILTPKAGEV